MEYTKSDPEQKQKQGVHKVILGAGARAWITQSEIRSRSTSRSKE